MSRKINWKHFDRSFAKHYSRRGKPAMPVRFMAGALILKRIYNLSYRALARHWVENPYMQYFCSEAYFRHRFPCDPTDFAHFKNRIGQEGIDLIHTCIPELEEAEQTKVTQE